MVQFGCILPKEQDRAWQFSIDALREMLSWVLSAQVDLDIPSINHHHGAATFTGPRYWNSRQESGLHGSTECLQALRFHRLCANTD